MGLGSKWAVFCAIACLVARDVHAVGRSDRCDPKSVPRQTAEEFAADLAATTANSMPPTVAIPDVGNQFFAMDDVIAAFGKKNPGTSVGLITLPPGLLLQAIKAGGWTFDGKEYICRISMPR